MEKSKEIKRKQIGKTTYFELFANCPINYSDGKYAASNNWIHKDCGGTIYIGDNAYYLCDSCNSEEHVKNWKISSPDRSFTVNTDIEEKESIPTGLLFAGIMVNETGLIWLQTFIKNTGKF